MCDPVTITTLAISAVSAAASYQGQRNAANLQQQQITANVNANQSALQVQQNQVNEQSTQQMSERAKAAMIERGRFLAISADSGLGGNAQSRGLNDIQFGESTDMATLEANRLDTSAQLNRDSVSQVRQGNQYLASIREPSLLGAGLQIAGSTLSAYGSQNRPSVKVDPGLGGGAAAP